MGWSIEDILDPQFIDTAYRELTPVGMAQSPLLAFAGSGQDKFGDTIEVDIIPSERTPAPTNNFGAPARTLQTKGLKPRYYTAIHAFNKIRVEAQTTMYLRQESSPELQSKGAQELDRQIEYFKLKHTILREVALSKSFFQGVIYRDADGNITETDQGGATIDLGVSATHKDQLGGIIGTAWDNAAATILTDLDDIKIQAQVEGKPEPKHIWCHSTVKRWLRDNTELKAYFQNSNMTSAGVDQVLSGSMIENLGGYTWHFYDGTYVDSGGTTRYLCPLTQVAITPDMGPWFRNINASWQIPREVGIMQGEGGANLAGAYDVAYGDKLYLFAMHDPPNLFVYGGTAFLYAFHDPDAVWMPTVDF